MTVIVPAATEPAPAVNLPIEAKTALVVSRHLNRLVSNPNRRVRLMNATCVAPADHLAPHVHRADMAAAAVEIPNSFRGGVADMAVSIVAPTRHIAICIYHAAP